MQVLWPDADALKYVFSADFPYFFRRKPPKCSGRRIKRFTGRPAGMNPPLPGTDPDNQKEPADRLFCFKDHSAVTFKTDPVPAGDMSLAGPGKKWRQLRGPEEPYQHDGANLSLFYCPEQVLSALYAVFERIGCFPCVQRILYFLQLSYYIIKVPVPGKKCILRERCVIPV